MLAIAKAILNTELSRLTKRSGEFPALVSGLLPVHRANLISALHLETGRPVFVVCPDETTAEALSRDTVAFSGIEGLSVSSRDFMFYSAEGVSRGSEQQRITALDAMLNGESAFVFCTASGLAQRTIPPDALRAAVFTVSVGETISPDSVEERILRCGYIRTDQVEGSGQYARRGGILDFFSPAYGYPIRCDFWGDDVDSMGFFEIDSQRRTENVETARILPVAETLPAVSDGGVSGLADKIDGLISREKRRRNHSEKLLSNLNEDAERLRGTGYLAAADRYMGLIWTEKATVADYVQRDAFVVICEPTKCADRAKDYALGNEEDVKSQILSGTVFGAIADFWESFGQSLDKLKGRSVIMADAFTVGRYPIEPRAILGLAAKQLPSYGGNFETAAEDIRQYMDREFSVVILAGDERRAGLLTEFLRERKIPVALDTKLEKLPRKGKCAVSVGGISTGFEYPGLAVLTDSQVVSTGFIRRSRRSKAAGDRQRLGSYADLSVGDLVVHEHHGIGRFAGIIKMPVEGIQKDYVKICYSGSDVLYVPAMQLDLVSKYIGAGEDSPTRLSKMGGSEWTRAKTRAKAAAKDLAAGLIKLYAERQSHPGHAFSTDKPWQTEFEDGFGYQETDDQLRSIEEIKSDMERRTPMDRLLCGDVGYGKTEVALRAVMKCVLDGKQAAILVPTTVLAQQHYQTARQRFFGYPVNIEVLSRFRSPLQVRESLQNIKSGKADIVIGTHRLLQKDISFRDLGLLVVDEEQRFGVSHKERLKEIGKGVDVLTLSATPIPRTLNMALSGIRDMSTIAEPPQNRLPVQTYVMEHDWGVVTDAIRREIARGGQVYYLHNRVENIERTAIRLSEMLGDGTTVAVAHGKMDEESLSSVMEAMVSGDCQVLVCTTIIETGIDIPNVNTLIIEDADKLGLAQLHQIRGRVGRSNRRASAYLTFRKDKVLTEIAEKRLSAVREFAEFNSGFKIAMRDLEIRGAGNLLGAEQSGHLISVGYDMYLKLLDEAVREARGERPQVRAECSADLAVTANIPESYVKSPEQRMDLYRRIAQIRTEEDGNDLTDELIDRFGDPPSAVNALIHVALLRGEATRAGICDISQKAGLLRFTLVEFDMAQISELYSRELFKGRIKVEATLKPSVSMKLRSQKRVIDQALEFVTAYGEYTRQQDKP